jgi:hypothetical protein
LLHPMTPRTTATSAAAASSRFIVTIYLLSK